MKYDQNIHKVVSKLNSYQTDVELSMNVKTDLISCPSQFPYFDEITCIKCEFPTYFSQRSKGCVNCADLSNCPPVYHSNKVASNEKNKNYIGIEPNQVK